MVMINLAHFIIVVFTPILIQMESHILFQLRLLLLIKMGKEKLINCLI